MGSAIGFVDRRLKPIVTFWVVLLAWLILDPTSILLPHSVEIQRVKPVVLAQADIPARVSNATILINSNSSSHSVVSFNLKNSTGGDIERLALSLAFSDPQRHVRGGEHISRLVEISNGKSADLTIELGRSITTTTGVVLAIQSLNSTSGIWQIDPVAFHQLVKKFHPADSTIPIAPPAKFNPDSRSEAQSGEHFFSCKAVTPVKFLVAAASLLPQGGGGPPPCDPSAFCSNCISGAQAACGPCCLDHADCYVTSQYCLCDWSCKSPCSGCP